jgi:RNA polymerase sigma factor for flagellar operon FliA
MPSFSLEPAEVASPAAPDRSSKIRLETTLLKAGAPMPAVCAATHARRCTMWAAHRHNGAIGGKSSACRSSAAPIARTHGPAPTRATPAMISMQGVPSSLIARNESWVRQQASALARRMPSNVEKADLIQAGLIAVAQSALGFQWEGDPESPAAQDAFVRYARLRVKGAMLDELRQMDHLGRAQRRQVKVVQIARERWRANHDAAPSLAELSAVCGISVTEIARLEQAALMAQAESQSHGNEDAEDAPSQQAATPRDEVEARVDTAILMRRLESFFATLPARDRQLIDAYLGVGLSPVQLAGSWNITPSRVSQLYKAMCARIARHLQPTAQRVTDRASARRGPRFDALVAEREAELATAADAGPWGEQLERTLTLPNERLGQRDPSGPLVVDSSTRWG